MQPRRKPWVSGTPIPSPEGAEESYPDVARVVGDVVLLQESHEFVLERMFLVVNFLIGDHAVVVITEHPEA